MRFIGDVHGKWLDYCNVFLNPEDPATESIQVGDFGVGFPDTREEYIQQTKEYMDEGNHRFIRGNHDNPNDCPNWEQWIPDGMTENGMMFVGGAHSIDQAMRTEGVSWWEDEELSYTQLAEMIVKYEEYKPRIMVTHDCPDSVSRHLFKWMTKNQIPSRTRTAFDTMLHAIEHKPEWWIFGHHHANRAVEIFGTKFVCLGELQYLDIDV